MLSLSPQRFIQSVRDGINAGFIAGLIIIFLILIGLPIRLQNLALFLLLLVMVIFGSRLARRLRDESIGKLLSNALAMGVVAVVLVFLLLSLINGWQRKGIDTKQYFDAVSLETVELLSGVPQAELFPNPPIDPFTGEYVEGEPLRTDPMQLTFDSDTGLILRLGLTGSAWFDVNLGIGGLYGLFLLLSGIGLASAVVTRLAIDANVGESSERVSGVLARNPITHWIVLLMPLILFAFVWLTENQGSRDAVFSLGSSSQQIQLLVAFLIILFALIAIRAAQPASWSLNYQMRVGICAGAAVALIALGIWRIFDGNSFFLDPIENVNEWISKVIGNDIISAKALSTAVLVLVGLAVVAQNVIALRDPQRFEPQLTMTLALCVMLILPLYMDLYQNDVLTLVGINIMLGLGLNIVVGYAGLLDLGYVAFFALGAYTYGFLSSQQILFDDKTQESLGPMFPGNNDVVIRIGGWTVTTLILASLVVYAGLKWWQTRAYRAPKSQRTLLDLPARPNANTTFLLAGAAILTSLIIAVILESTGLYKELLGGMPPFLVGLLGGVIVAGLAGIMLGIPVLRLRGDYLAIVTLGFGEIIRLLFNNLRDLTGGPQGVLQIPRPVSGSSESAVMALAYLVFLGAGAVAFLSMRLKASRTGRAWSAMKSNESIAQSMGVNLVQSKLMAFAIGAAFAGVGGVLFAARQRNIFPSDFSLDISISVLSLVIIGGMGSIPGVIMGAIVLIGIPEVLRELSTYRILVFGALLVTMVIIRPKGLLPAPMPQLQERARALVAQRKESES